METHVHNDYVIGRKRCSPGIRQPLSPSIRVGGIRQARRSSSMANRIDIADGWHPSASPHPWSHAASHVIRTLVSGGGDVLPPGFQTLVGAVGYVELISST